MIKKGTILICNRDISDTTIGKEYLVIKDDIIEDDTGYGRYMKYHVEEGSFSVKSLKIGDTFEYNGFICRVESEVERWYKIEDNKNNKVAFEKLCKQDVLDILKLPYTKLTEITNKEFIKQLEENALS